MIWNAARLLSENSFINIILLFRLFYLCGKMDTQKWKRCSFSLCVYQIHDYLLDSSHTIYFIYNPQNKLVGQVFNI